MNEVRELVARSAFGGGVATAMAICRCSSAPRGQRQRALGVDTLGLATPGHVQLNPKTANYCANAQECICGYGSNPGTRC